jgi:hypothetical protein
LQEHLHFIEKNMVSPQMHPEQWRRERMDGIIQDGVHHPASMEIGSPKLPLEKWWKTIGTCDS